MGNLWLRAFLRSPAVVINGSMDLMVVGLELVLTFDPALACYFRSVVAYQSILKTMHGNRDML